MGTSSGTLPLDFFGRSFFIYYWLKQLVMHLTKCRQDIGEISLMLFTASRSHNSLTNLPKTILAVAAG
jgi:hypothetical protein